MPRDGRPRTYQVRKPFQLAQARWRTEDGPRLEQLSLQLPVDLRRLENMECPMHQSCPGRISTAEEKGLRLLIQASLTGNLAISIGFRSQELMVNRRRMRQVLQILWVTGERANLPSQELTAFVRETLHAQLRGYYPPAEDLLDRK